MAKKLSKSQKKFLRKEKARIRRKFVNSKKRRSLIDELLNKYFKEK